jgi:hypothetical protein
MNPRDDFVVKRLLHDIPSYHRQPWGERVQAIPYESQKAPLPAYLMSGSGRLVRFTPEMMDDAQPSSVE